MQLNIRMLPPQAIAKRALTVNGRAYSGTPGQTFDAPDFDASVLGANGWITVAPSGPTSARPGPTGQATQPYVIAPGFKFFDTSLSALVVWDGAAWRDPSTGTAV